MEQNIMLSWGHIWAIIGGIFGVGAFFYKLTDKKFDKQDAYMREAKKDTDAKFDKQDAYMREAKKDTDAKFDKINEKVDHLGERMGKFENRMTALEVELRGMNQRLSNVESCVMPRKVYHIEEPHKDEAKEN